MNLLDESSARGVWSYIPPSAVTPIQIYLYVPVASTGTLRTTTHESKGVRMLLLPVKKIMVASESIVKKSIFYSVSEHFVHAGYSI